MYFTMKAIYRERSCRDYLLAVSPRPAGLRVWGAPLGLCCHCPCPHTDPSHIRSWPRAHGNFLDTPPSSPFPSCGVQYCSCCSVTKSRLTICNPMDCGMPGSPVLHFLPEFAQTHVYWISNAIQPSHPLSPQQFHSWACIWNKTNWKR